MANVELTELNMAVIYTALKTADRTEMSKRGISFGMTSALFGKLEEAMDADNLAELRKGF